MHVVELSVLGQTDRLRLGEVRPQEPPQLVPPFQAATISHGESHYPCLQGLGPTPKSPERSVIVELPLHFHIASQDIEIRCRPIQVGPGFVPHDDLLCTAVELLAACAQGINGRPDVHVRRAEVCHSLSASAHHVVHRHLELGHA